MSTPAAEPDVAGSPGGGSAGPAPDALPGVRSTRQRTAVADVLNRVDGFRSAQELHDLLRRTGAPVDAGPPQPVPAVAG